MRTFTLALLALLIAPSLTMAGDESWWDGFALPNFNGLPSLNAATEYGGSLIVGGAFTAATLAHARHVAAWDGTSWSALGAGVPFTVQSLGLHAGGLVAAGDGVPANIQRWNGTTWTALGTGANGSVYALTSYNGDLIAAGTFTSIDGVTAAHIARWDGATWHPLAVGLAGTVRALCVHGTKLIAAGSFASPGGGVAQWDGSGWSAMGNGLQYPGNSLAVYGVVSDGTSLYASGMFSKSGVDSVPGVARWDGSQWNRMGPATRPQSSPLTLLGGAVVAQGVIASTGGVLASWSGSGWVPLNDSLALSGGPISLATWGSKLIVLGVRVTNPASNVGSDPLRQLDGATWSTPQQVWSPIMSGLRSYVWSLTVWNDKLIAIGGVFFAGDRTSRIPTGNVAAWDGTSWSPLGAGVFPAWASTGTTFQGDLIVGGHFTTAGGATAKSIARWNGASWSALGAGLTDPGYADVYATTTYNGDLIAGGFILNSGAITVNGIARWDGSLWQPLGSGLDRYSSDFDVVSALLPWGNDLIAGGQIGSAGGIAVNNLARWDGSSWHDVGGGVDGGVGALEEFEGDLVVTGSFTHAGGVPTVAGIARWNGSTWSTFADTSVTSVGYVEVVDGHLYAITRSAANPNDALSSWNGTRWTPLGSGFDGSASAIADYHGDIYVGGNFGWANGKASFNLARWQGLSLVGVTPWPDAMELSFAAPRPNPSSSVAAFAFTLPSAGPVRLEIVDVAGRRVALLIDGQRPQGSLRVEWAGRDAAGRLLAPGLYFAHLTTTHGQRTTRVVRTR